MRILITTQYFWPESFIINDLVKTLTSQGHSVKVLTGKPNYPDGNVFNGYSEEGIEEELFEKNISIFRVPLRPRKTGGAKNLFLNYWSFIWNGLRFFPDAVKNESYDAIFVFAPSPITMAIPAIYLKWKLKTHLAIWVQDLWPESLSATGFVKNRFLLGLVKIMVRGIYSQSDTLLVQSKGFIKPVSHYANANKVIYYPNSYKDNKSVSEINNKALPDAIANLMEQYFCVTFAGNLGKAQSLETIIDAADKLKHLPNIRIILVGSGSLSDWILDQKLNRKLDNLILAGRFPAEVMPQFFIRSEALLVTLKKEEIFSYTVPSKIQSYLAAGRPIIAALDGEGARVIEDSRAGLTCEAEDVEGLVSCIERLYNMTDTQKQNMSKKGRAYYEHNFEMESQVKNLTKILENRILSNEKK